MYFLLSQLMAEQFSPWSVQVSQYTFAMCSYREKKAEPVELLQLDGYTVDYTDPQPGNGSRNTQLCSAWQQAKLRKKKYITVWSANLLLKPLHTHSLTTEVFSLTLADKALSQEAVGDYILLNWHLNHWPADFVAPIKARQFSQIWTFLRGFCLLSCFLLPCLWSCWATNSELLLLSTLQV